MILCQVDNHKVFFILKIASHICLFLLLLNCPVMYLVQFTSFCEYSVLRIFTSHSLLRMFTILPVQILHKFEMNMYALIFGLSVTHTRYVYTH